MLQTFLLAAVLLPTADSIDQKVAAEKARMKAKTAPNFVPQMDQLIQIQKMKMAGLSYAEAYEKASKHKTELHVYIGYTPKSLDHSATNCILPANAPPFEEITKGKVVGKWENDLFVKENVFTGEPTVIKPKWEGLAKPLPFPSIQTIPATGVVPYNVRSNNFFQMGNMSTDACIVDMRGFIR